MTHDVQCIHRDGCIKGIRCGQLGACQAPTCRACPEPPLSWSDYCGRHTAPPIAKQASFDTRVKLMQVIIGMAKESGYDLDRFILEVRTGWPHVK